MEVGVCGSGIMPKPVNQCQGGDLAVNVEYSYPKGAVPATGTQCHAIRTDPQAADAVLVTGQDSNTFTLERIPDIASPVIVSTKENTPGDGEGDGCDATQDVVVRK